jgi:hypothetical protein
MLPTIACGFEWTVSTSKAQELTLCSRCFLFCVGVFVDKFVDLMFGVSRRERLARELAEF